MSNGFKRFVHIGDDIIKVNCGGGSFLNIGI